MSEKPYVQTDTILDTILSRTIEDVQKRKNDISLDDIRTFATASARQPRDFATALRRDTVALIAEVKKASPSKGVLIDDFDPLRIAGVYAENGAAAISVLTDEPFFQGHLDYMEAVSTTYDVPVLRKDFVVVPYQVYEARIRGADAVLLIVATMDNMQLYLMHELITGLGMTPLVEVHNEREMERALTIEAKVIGINNRDLRTFRVDLKTTERLARLVPDDVTLVAESGIMSADDVRQMGELGAHAVLVGESLVTAADMAAAVRAYSRQKR